MPQKQKIYASPSVTADTVIFTIENGSLEVLLIKRKDQPFVGQWALPGVYLLKNESAKSAASRALSAKAGVKATYLEQLYTFDSPFRDPRGHVVSITYFALIPKNKINLKQNNYLQMPTIFPINKLPKLAFDHKKIVEYATSRLRSKLEYTNIVYSLLPNDFTLGQLQKTYEAINGKKLDKRNFRKKFLALNLIKTSKKKLSGVQQRPAELFHFIQRHPQELKKFF